MPTKRIPGDKRSHRAWRVLVKQVVREEPECRLRLPGCTGKSTTADHILSVHDRPDLCLSRANVRGSCRSCNLSRGRRSLDEARQPSKRRKTKTATLDDILGSVEDALGALDDGFRRDQRGLDWFDDDPRWKPVR